MQRNSTETSFMEWHVSPYVINSKELSTFIPDNKHDGTELV